MRSRATAILLVLAACAPDARGAVSLPADGMLKADGPITALTRASGRVVLSGDFGHIGPYVGGGLALDPRTGAREAGFARFDGQVSDVIADGAGGFYVAGQFNVDGDRRAVAHVLASGAVDLRFSSLLSGFADSLVLAGPRLYVGRWFGDGRVAALDTATGAPVTGFRSAKVGTITELALAGDRLLVGTTGSVSALDAATGARATGFACADCADRVMGLAVAGDTAYVGLRDRGVIAIDATTGARRSGFAPSPNRVAGPLEDAGPMTLLVDGDRLIVGGRGLRLGGPSSSLAALDLRTGAADPSFGRGLVNPVHDLVRDGTSLYAAGAPRTGRPAPVLRLDARTGAYRDALVPKLDGPVDALARSGSRLFAGGRFGVADGVTTDGVAEVSAYSGRLIPGFAVHDLPAGATENAPLVLGSTLYLTSETTPGRARVTALLARTGAPRPGFAARTIAFDPRSRTDSYGAAWDAGRGLLYAAHVNGDPRTEWPQSTVEILSARTGRRVAHYDLPYRGYVTGVLRHGPQLLVTGSFRRWWPDGRPRHLATMSVNPQTGAINERFDAHTNGPTNSILDHADRLYLQGLFKVAYGRTRDGFASVYDNTGALVAGFNRNVWYAKSLGSEVTVGFGGNRLYGGDPYSGDRWIAFPTVASGFADSFALVPGGVLFTASASLPFYDYAAEYDQYLALVPPNWVGP